MHVWYLNLSSRSRSTLEQAGTRWTFPMRSCPLAKERMGHGAPRDWASCPLGDDEHRGLHSSLPGGPRVTELGSRRAAGSRGCLRHFLERHGAQARPPSGLLTRQTSPPSRTKTTEFRTCTGFGATKTSPCTCSNSRGAAVSVDTMRKAGAEELLCWSGTDPTGSYSWNTLARKVRLSPPNRALRLALGRRRGRL